MNKEIKKTLFDKIDKLKKEEIINLSLENQEKTKIAKLQADNFESFIEKYIDKTNIREYTVNPDVKETIDRIKKRCNIPTRYKCTIDLFIPEPNFEVECKKCDIIRSLMNYIMDRNFVEEMKNRGYENINIDYPLKLISFDVIK